jgi:hypothetical protein
MDIEVKKALLDLEKVRKDVEEPGWDKSLHKELKITIQQPESALKHIAKMIETIPAIIEKIMTLDNTVFLGKAGEAKKAVLGIPDQILKRLELENEAFKLKIKEAKDKKVGLATIPDQTTKDLLVDIQKAVLSIKTVETRLASIKPKDIVITATNKVALDNIAAVIKKLAKLPEHLTKTLTIHTAVAEAAIKNVIKLMDDIPPVTIKKLLIKAKLQASPEQPFTQGINYMTDQMEGLPKESKFVVKVGGAGLGDQGADPRFTDPIPVRTDPRTTDPFGRAPIDPRSTDPALTRIDPRSTDPIPVRIDPRSTDVGDITFNTTVVLNDVGTGVKDDPALTDMVAKIDKKIAENIKNGNSEIPRNLKKYRHGSYSGGLGRG